MAWQTELVQILRHLISDLDESSFTYSQTRLEETILVASQFLQTETDFDNTYVVEIDGHSLTPDPTDLSIKDNYFINLVCLHASIVILRGELKSYALEAIRIVDGPSSIDTVGRFTAIKARLDELSKTYERVKLQQKMGNACQIILTPYTYDNVSNIYFPE